MISWSFIKNQVALIYWNYPEFLSSKVDTLDNAGKLAQELTEANHEYLKDMFAYEISTPVLELAIIKALTKSDAKFAIIQIPGSVIASEFTIRTMNHMEKNEDCGNTFKSENLFMKASGSSNQNSRKSSTQVST